MLILFLCGYLQSPKYTYDPAAAKGSGGGNNELSAVVVARDEAVVLDGGRQHSVSCAASHIERKALAAASFSGGSGGSRPRGIQLVVQP